MKLPPNLEAFESYSQWLRSIEGYAQQGAFSRVLPANPPRESFYRGAFSGVTQALNLFPYEHQVAALDLLEQGHNIVAATSTASGKSLVFQLPALKAALEGQHSLLVYPTKALAYDQLERLQHMAQTLGLEGAVHTYDGDTREKARHAAKAQARIVLTNPDMLHFGLLAFHSDWAHFWSNLRYLVLDELHAYRGVFGTNVALVLRRLMRIARHYGANPQLIAASATIANPQEHAQNVTGEPFTELKASLSRAEREFVLWQPKALDQSGQVRRSANLEAALLARFAAQSGLKALVFANSRKTAELVSRYAAHEAVRPYRAGFTAAERRALEEGIKHGELKVLVSTSALELGVDIGQLDMVVLLGYPGSLAAFWQRAGRAGRGQRRSLVVWIPREDPLDAYFVENPQLLLGSSPESAVADPENPVLYPQHLHCAAREWPIALDEPIYHPLLAQGLQQRHQKLYTPKRNPHREVVLRGLGRTLQLKDAGGRSLGTIDERQALWETHPGAVYLHGGESYLVRNLDLEERQVVLLPGMEDYYTQPRAQTDLEVLEGSEALAGVWVGRVRLREQVTGFVKKRFMSETVLDEIPLSLPELTFETEAMWFHPPEVLPEAQVPGAIHALEHCLIGLLPLLVLAERSDIGGVSYPFYPWVLPSGSGSTIFVYDGYPGGVGYAKAAARRFGVWIKAARDLLLQCPCETGCPRCVMSPKCGNGNQPLDKAGALKLAEALSTTYNPVRPSN